MNKNYFSDFKWPSILHLYENEDFEKNAYHKILCRGDYPEFINKYLELPLLKRLSGIGLLCGSDWTKLFHNRMFYSRLDHSIGVALIIWNFTHNKGQTIAGLLHDVSTPVFSHVSDFRKGDALTQTITESLNDYIIRNDFQLNEILKADGLSYEQVHDYHLYPIADNEIPFLSADRLEYMFPSGAVLEGSWNLADIKNTYDDITILKNENDIDELGFKSVEIALEYCRKFCMTGHILQMHEDKICLNMLGQIMNMAVKNDFLEEKDFMELSEQQIIERIEAVERTEGTDPFFNLYKTFRNMEEVLHTNECLDTDNFYCLNLQVKQRYINPLVKTESGIIRLNNCSSEAAKIINDFLSWEDTKFGCVRYL